MHLDLLRLLYTHSSCRSQAASAATTHLVDNALAIAPHPLTQSAYPSPHPTPQDTTKVRLLRVLIWPVDKFRCGSWNIKMTNHRSVHLGRNDRTATNSPSIVDSYGQQESK